MSEIKIAELVETAKRWGKVIKTALLGIGVLLTSYFVPKLTMDHHEQAQATEQQPVAPSQASPPAALPSVSFTVASVGQSRTGKKFLNNTANYRESTQTIVLEGQAAAALDVNSMKGKTITAFGKASEYKGKPQIVVTDPASITVR